MNKKRKENKMEEKSIENISFGKYRVATKLVQLKLPEALYDELLAVSKAEKIPVTKVCRAILEDYFPDKK